MSERTRRVEGIFHEAISIASDEDRDAFLQRVCGSDQRLRAEVARLVADHYQGRSSGIKPIAGDEETSVRAVGTEQVGCCIGPYKLRERVGEGGMGVVWAAEQKQPIHRKVAIKVIKPGMDSEQVVARFSAEREALSMMDHPNIARALDAGTTEQGRPFFVMELIRGVPITDYCDAHRLTVADRIELFLPVCRAIHHAHQKGVIHRDVKPSNVLVTELDAVAVPKVIDFGVAKALYHRLTDLSIYTGVFQAVGTLPYMSPEQAAVSSTDVDTRSDIYGLGVLLYELLTGVTPFDKEKLASAAVDEAFRMIRETEPPKPSKRLSTLGARTTEIARRRETHSAGLSKAIRGDLDWIVMKAMEKDRARRYETATALAEDLQRHLAHRPVLARPPSIVYRGRKYCRRHRIGVTVSALLVCFFGITSLLVYALGRPDREVAAERERIEKQRKEFLEHEQRIRNQHEALRNAVPEIEALVERGDFWQACDKLNGISHAIGDDLVYESLLDVASFFVSITSSPEEVEVSVKPWDQPHAPWRVIGTTPLQDERVPRGVLRWRFAREGFAGVETAIDVNHPGQMPFGPPPNMHVVLVPEATVPSGMVQVRMAEAEFGVGRLVDVDDFFIDQYEVTNEDYLEFVHGNGYLREEYWEHTFVRDGAEISWREAMDRFKDQTGHHGPANWRNGTFPPGQERFPVSGVSWYEAAAYAKFRGKELPTIHHWLSAAYLPCAQHITALSNFDGRGPAAVGSYRGIGLYEVYDLAGNVKEWCFNATRDGQRWVKGGAWSDPTYMLSLPDAAGAFVRDPTIGFRCAVYSAPPAAEALVPREFYNADYSVKRPASEETVAAFLRQFLYDRKKPLNAQKTKDEAFSARGIECRRERIIIDAAYAGEAVPMDLYLPSTSQPPYQTIVVFPGATAFTTNIDRDQWLNPVELGWMHQALLAQGRAICFPIYKGQFFRNEGYNWRQGGISLRDNTVSAAKDLSRVLDYLRTRDDIDHQAIAYLGDSYGAAFGPLMCACGPVFSGAILVAGGLCDPEVIFEESVPPEVDPFNYLRLMNTPTLLLTNRLDAIFPRNVSQVPFVEGIGSASKEWHEYDTVHGAFPLGEVVKLTDEWCSRVMGAVTKSPNAQPSVAYDMLEDPTFVRGLADRQLRRAEELTLDGEPERALDLLGEVLKSRPLDADVIARRANVHAHLEQWEQCMRDVQAAWQLAPDRWQESFRTAFGNTGQAGRKPAIDLLTSRIARQADDEEVYFERAHCHARLRQWDLAMDDYAEAARIAPDNFWVWLFKAVVDLRAGNRQQYRTDCEQLLRLVRGGPGEEGRVGISVWVFVAGYDASHDPPGVGELLRGRLSELESEPELNEFQRASQRFIRIRLGLPTAELEEPLASDATLAAADTRLRESLRSMQLGSVREAREWYDQARQLIDTSASEDSEYGFWQLIRCEILAAEVAVALSGLDE